LRGKQRPAILVDAIGADLYRGAQYASDDIVVNLICRRPLKYGQSYTCAYSFGTIGIAEYSPRSLLTEFLIELLPP
jgi:hypothetical protein